jgi:hypothetical protein
MKSPVNAALIALAVSSAQYAAAQDCRPITVGVDTSLANNSVVIATYEAVGEIFFARDTLVRSLTVWRVASEAGSVIGLRAYIVGTYSSGTPDITQLLWESAPLVKQGDGVHPTQFTWEMDPPLALPHRGQYAFYIYYSPCIGYVDLLAREPDAYSDGFLFGTGRSNSCEIPDGDAYYLGNVDLVFTLEYCTDVVTRAAPSTWGQLKLIYRDGHR